MSYYLQLLTQIARTQGLQRKFDDAQSTLDTVEVMLTDELKVAKVRYLLERGRVFNSFGDKDEARPLFLRAWQLAAENNEDYYAIDAIHMLQIVDPPEKQLDWANKAIDLAEKTEDERAKNWLGSLYHNTGWSYHDLGQYNKALDMFDKSLIWHEQYGDEYSIIIAKWCIARTYRSLGTIAEALFMQRQLEEEIEEKGLDHDGYVFEEIAECLLLMGNNKEAQKYFKSAYEILSQDEWLKANQPARLKRLKTLGQ
jgi:tetratricopeptide (TPR) repeat protein